MLFYLLIPRVCKQTHQSGDLKTTGVILCLTACKVIFCKSSSKRSIDENMDESWSCIAWLGI